MMAHITRRHAVRPLQGRHQPQPAESVEEADVAVALGALERLLHAV